MNIEALSSESEKIKSSHRIYYEAQVKVIKQQIGELDSIRQRLGLSQRKICQLLMVDPSAWTRWTRKGHPIPPHIYRALQWYMILQDKLPGLTPQYFVGKDPEVLHQTALRKIEHESDKMNQDFQTQNHFLLKRIESLENSLKIQKNIFFWATFFIIFCIVSYLVYALFLN